MSIYDKHKAHTSRVGAYAILYRGEHVANVTIAYPRDGASRLHAYVHWLGTEMVRGHANGYGYDKRTAAVSNAAEKGVAGIDKKARRDTLLEEEFWKCLLPDSGTDWTDNLRNAGFTVCSVC